MHVAIQNLCQSTFCKAQLQITAGQILQESVYCPADITYYQFHS